MFSIIWDLRRGKYKHQRIMQIDARRTKCGASFNLGQLRTRKLSEVIGVRQKTYSLLLHTLVHSPKTFLSLSMSLHSGVVRFRIGRPVLASFVMKILFVRLQEIFTGNTLTYRAY